jgi:dTDP-4-amino-4,6-dideoxy-D-galactose acyltransferase
MVRLESLEWDTQHFGVSVGRLSLGEDDTVEEVTRSLGKSKFDCVMCRVPTANTKETNLLEEAGFKLKDIRVHLDLDLEGYSRSRRASESEIRPMQSSDISQVRAISRSSFWSTHFHMDEGFRRDKVDEMYSLWIDKALRENYGMSVAYQDGKVVGFLASKEEDGSFYIELVAVAKDSRGKGIGEDLVAQSLDQAKRDFSSATIGVQLTNVAAIRLYEKIGFRILSSESTFHWWRR